MTVAVVTFPGSNCDQDCVQAVETAGGRASAVWHRDSSLEGADAVVLPGGFAHGDYLRPGAIARFSPVMEAVTAFAEAGGLVVGICNGFQVLCEAGLLPGALLRNESLRFQSHECRVRVERSDTPFTGRYQAGQVLRMPLSHADGNYYADPDTLAALEAAGRVLFRYCDAHGQATEAANPNGSQSHVAGICNARGNILGMMPHPDRATEPLLGSSDGLPLFQALLDAARVQEAARELNSGASELDAARSTGQPAAPAAS